jgi:hypothetical protein
MFKAIASSFHQPPIATHLNSNNDRLFSQTYQMYKAIALLLHNQRSQLISNQSAIAYFLRHDKRSKRSPHHSTNQQSHLKSNSDRLSVSETLNVQSDRLIIPPTNDRNSSQIKQRSPIFSDTLNLQRDRTLTSQTNDRNSSQIKLRSPIFDYDFWVSVLRMALVMALRVASAPNPQAISAK